MPTPTTFRKFDDTQALIIISIVVFKLNLYSTSIGSKNRMHIKVLPDKMETYLFCDTTYFQGRWRL